MEGGGGLEEEKKKPLEGENKTKRKMKTAAQLEVLEKTYAAEAYPSEALRAELSLKLGLSDRQLQMWFCHRRLKDRKAARATKKPQNDSLPEVAPASAPVGEDVEQIAVVDARHGSGLASGLRPYGRLELQQVVPRAGMAFPRTVAGMPAMGRNSCYKPHQTIEEQQAIAFVERQLGEPLREDGPILGVEFDSLPPGAFGAPIGAVTIGHNRQSGRPFEENNYENLDKGVSRTLHEYQFIPEQPTVRNETYDRVSHHYSSLDCIPYSRTLLSSGKSFLNGNESTPYRYGVQGQLPGLNLMSQQGRQNHLFSSASRETDVVPQKNPFVDVAVETHSGAHSITLMDSPLMPSDRRVIHEAELSSFQRKRKNDEFRMQLELETQEKRMRKELEKQDVLRRKREEQIKKEMERQDRERRKEEERLSRERQREEERYQREQRRELERREKFLQKESIRAEKLRQKEELRREKEAARIKAANERATARRMAKESMELIEDERLELMELATSKKGLSSILALDDETMQKLELYGDDRTPFPPKSVQLKRPLSIQPWLHSEENTGNLLMVWRFLITFADVLGIWPFTLDELLQAFHDYDPMLLGEIHIALLRCIIKDIEDVARTSSTESGAYQNSVANTGGGHSQLVEGACAWGFDIRNWQRRLNPLTWPEILRQFALSAGFGPQLKKQNIEQVHLCDNNEGNDGKDIIFNLRSGAAVANAVATMRGKGLSNPRRSRHRLTPGTVKFAAFHVLSVEGSNGLNILEVADKIQKSGLRDLTTSKTPEASIGAALSRDTKLFERTAPSTYCVRPAYRKDPADSEAIFSAARERIRIFRNGFVDAEEEDGGRDEDSESEVGEDPNVDDLGAETNTKEGPVSEEFNANTSMRSRKDIGEDFQSPDSCHKKMDEGLASIVAEGFNAHRDVANPNIESRDIDESIPGEPWVQGLMEGEYSDLSVEERLNALVALVGLALEGNSIRVILEERLEAANALKKQMWAEAQLDKRRVKEDYFIKMHSVPYLGNKSGPTFSFPSVEGKQSPLLAIDDKNDKASPTPHVQHRQIDQLQENQNHLQSSPLEVNTQMQDCSTSQDNYYIHQIGYAGEKSRSNLKSYIGHLAEQTYSYRSLPLGMDRRRNRYWQFIISASQNDPGCGRIFVELHDGCWRLIDSEEGFDALLASLDVRGIRESQLHMMLLSIEMPFKESVRRHVLSLNDNMRRQNGDTVRRLKIEGVEGDTNLDCSANIHCSTSVCIDDLDVSETSTSFVVQLGGNKAENDDAFMRYQDFEKWMLNECLNSSILCAMKFGKMRCGQLLAMCDLCHDVYLSEGIPCPSCHRGSSKHLASDGNMKIGTDYFHVSSSLPLRMRLLKVLLSIVEVTIPQQAFQSFWTDSYRKSWSMKLDASSSTEDLLQILTVLEGAIKREYLASNYETTCELLGSLCSSGCPMNDSESADWIAVLPWVPSTTAAVALRLLELDASTFYTFQQKLENEKDKRIGIIVKLPSKFASAKNSYNAGAIENSDQTKQTKENMVDHGAGVASCSRGQKSQQGRGRSCGSRSQGRNVSSRSASRKRSATTSSRKVRKLLGWKGRPCGRGGHVRGCRSVRSWQKPAAAQVDEINGERDNANDIMDEAPSVFVREEINGGEMEGIARTSSSSEISRDDDICQATGDRYDYLVDNDGYQGGLGGKSENIIDEEDDAIDVNDDNDDDGQVDLDVEDYVIGDSYTGYNREENAEQNMDPDGDSFTSSDYSD